MDIILEPNNIDTYVIIALMFILIISFFIWIFFKKYKEPGKNNVYFECNYGECATLIGSGTKRCPLSNDEKILYNAAYEVCNGRTICDNSVTPYAVNADLSTNDVGICPEDTTCLCLTKPQCAANVTVLWTAQNGSIYSDTYNKENLTFTQTSSSSQGSYQPIQYNDTATEFCGLQIFYLDRIAPGTCILGTSPQGDISTISVSECVQANPCVSGVMAFNPLDLETFHMSETNIDNAINVPLICTQGSLSYGRSRECVFYTQVPVYDRTLNTIRCYNWSSEKYETRPYSIIKTDRQVINGYQNIFWNVISEETSLYCNLNENYDGVIINTSGRYYCNSKIVIYRNTGYTEINFWLYRNNVPISEVSYNSLSEKFVVLDVPEITLDLYAGDTIKLYGGIIGGDNTLYTDMAYPEGYVAILDIILLEIF